MVLATFVLSNILFIALVIAIAVILKSTIINTFIIESSRLIKNIATNKPIITIIFLGNVVKTSVKSAYTSSVSLVTLTYNVPDGVLS